MKTLLAMLAAWGLALGAVMGNGDGGPGAGTQLDTDADGTWDYVMLEDGSWDPPLTSMPPPGTLVDMDGDDVADSELVDQNGNGTIDGVDIGRDGTVDMPIEEGDGGGGGDGDDDGGGGGGPGAGTQLDTDADGTWDHVMQENGDFDPPLMEIPPPGTLVDYDGDNVADAVLVDQDGDGVIDGLDTGMDGTVDIPIDVGDGGDGDGDDGDGDGGDGDDGPGAGTQLDTDADGTWDYVMLEDGSWDPDLTSMPPPGTLVDMDGDDVADAVLVDENGNGIIDGIDIGMDGTVDTPIEESEGGGGDGGGGGGGDGPGAGTQLDTDADGIWDHVMLEDGSFDPPLTSMPPPGTLVDMDGDNVADGVLVDQNGNGTIDGYDAGNDGTVDIPIEEGGGDDGGGGPPH
ncbi:MAG: hypothetical protein HYV35_07910 [Lentisphaerae bacterium]|nr:hypothetical protein [Lentisphaerota bacterium]